jgi:tetratricopeptide (TPR) repeat protein
LTVVFISGGLTFVVGLLIVRPFSVTGGRLHVRDSAPDDDRRRELLRQLRDLDDDLAAGKLTQADHLRLRDPVEREAAAVLRRKTQGPAGETAVVTSGLPQGRDAAQQGRDAAQRGRDAAQRGRDAAQRGRDAGRGARRRHRRTGTLLALAGAAGIIMFLLVGAVSSRLPGQTITGNSVAGATSAAGSPSSPAPASSSGAQSPTPQQLAAVAAAEAQVKQNPKDVSANLALADAYAAAGASQLAAVQYLVVTRLDPANAEANTDLALLAFEVGRAAQGKTMVDRVLTAHPNYPEALYVRGLISLIGLRQPQAAERDFIAYLAVAPFGSHRTAVVTLLALAQSQDHR